MGSFGSLFERLPLLLGFLPVLLFLVALLLMDSYKLVATRAIFVTIAIGCAAAILSFLVNRALLGLHVEAETLRRYVAPVVEEVIKAAYILYLIRSEKVGFMVDAGIRGFAVGTGFALVENLYYARSLGDYGVMLWLIRGLGTAIMHGSASAIVGILGKSLAERHPRAAWTFAPGLVIAIAVHSVFNHFLVSPLLAAGIMVLLMPLLVVAVFERSEKATQDWLGVEFDSEVELLEKILTGELTDTRAGRYLESLRQRFSGAVVSDMLCLLRVHLELALRAKGMLVAQAAGVRVAPDEHVRANFAELEYLRSSIGRTGMIAMLPILRNSGRDLWQLQLLSQRAERVENPKR